MTERSARELAEEARAQAQAGAADLRDTGADPDELADPDVKAAHTTSAEAVRRADEETDPGALAGPGAPAP